MTETDVVNIALTLLGENRIVSLTDGSKPANEANAIFTAARDELMSRYNWTFAVKRGQAPGADAPPFGFANAFDFPSDCLRIIRPGARYAGPDLTDYRIGPTAEYSVEGRQILTDWPEDGTNATGDNDKVVSIEITNAGVGFISAPDVVIAAPGGGGVTALATAYIGLAGVVPNVAIPGAGYSIYDILTLEGGTPGLDKGTMRVFQGWGVNPPSHYDVVNPGKYTTTPGALALSGDLIPIRQGCATSGGSGGASAQVDCWFRLSAIEITNPGSGYSAPPAVTFVPGIGTNGATATAILGDLAATYLNVLYVARIEDPNLWDPFFAKLLGAQLAMDLAEPLTQSPAKYQKAVDAFVRIFKAARDNNAIQLPPQKLSDDEWMLARR